LKPLADAVVKDKGYIDYKHPRISMEQCIQASYATRFIRSSLADPSPDLPEGEVEKSALERAAASEGSW
jgi:hypothetical protein